MQEGRPLYQSFCDLRYNLHLSAKYDPETTILHKLKRVGPLWAYIAGTHAVCDQQQVQQAC